MTMIRAFLLPVLLFICLAILPLQHLQADENSFDDSPKVELSLHANKDAIVAGEDLTLIIRKEIIPHWHTYWINPGDSGAETRFNFNLPQDFTIGEVSWPAPAAIPFGPLINYGYEDEVLFTVPVSVPDTLAPELADVTFHVDAEWLVCMDICIPEFGNASITLPVASNAATINEDMVERAQNALPQKDHKLTAAFNYDEAAKSFTLSVDGLVETNIEKQNTHFFPKEWGVILAAAPQAINGAEQGSLTLTTERDTRDITDFDTLDGVLRVGQHSYDITAKKDTTLLSTNTVPNTKQMVFEGNLTLALALIFAFIGGMILNLMPCVFPVLSMKALSLVKLSEKERHHAALHGVAYAGGIIVSFWVVAGSLIALQSLGAQIGWGFQLQNPIVTGLLAYLLFVLGLNLAGFFEFSNKLSGVGQGLTAQHSYKGSFFTGVLATLVATPCSAPFMASALGYALTQPAIISMLIFTFLGLGLAFPYVALTILPGLQRILPKPGAWMEKFRQFLSFPMFASALWLAWVFAQQSTTSGLIALFTGAISISFAIWIFATFKNIIAKILATILVIFSLSIPFTAPALMPSTGTETQTAEAQYTSFTPDALEQALQSNSPVFVNMTADWCITCKFNERIAFTHKVNTAIANKNIQYLKGDWTNQNADITAYLKSFGRNGVPLYVYYPAPDDQGIRGEPKILPQILTEGIVLNAFDPS